MFKTFLNLFKIFGTSCVICNSANSIGIQKAVNQFFMFSLKCIEFIDVKEASKYLIILPFTDSSWLDSIINAAMFTAGINVNTLVN